MQIRWMAVVALLGCSSHEAPPAPPAPLPPPVVPAPSGFHTHHVVVPSRDPVAAWSLTASDGSGLQLVSIDAKAVIEGPLAFTELHLVFHNPEPRVREGTFAITLPARASVSRFALVEGGAFKEAEVVAKALARRAYDDELHRGIAPAILEQAAGNEFTARVYPIPANGSKELVIAYSQELAGAGYVLPLMGLPKIDRVAVTLDAARADGTHDHQALHEARWQPDHDFIANVDPPAAITAPLDAGTWPGAGVAVAAAFELDPAGPAAAAPLTALTLLIDTSASRAPGFRRYLDRVHKLVGELGRSYPRLALDVTAFDQDTQAIYHGAVEGFGEAAIAALLARRAAGASDLAQAIQKLEHGRRIAIVTDGVVTAGAEGAALARAFHAIAPERVDVLLAGGIRDERAATAVTRTGVRPGDVFDLDQAIEPITTGLGQAVQVDVPIDVRGATWFTPHLVAAVRPGTQVMVFARLAVPAPAGKLDVTIGGVAHTVTMRAATPALVERAAARAEIEDLDTQLATATHPKASAALRKQIEQESVAMRVVSSQTSLLVLDSEQDYAHYGIDRAALVDILAVGAHGLELQHRTFIASKERHHARPALSREEALELARSAGMMGTMGTSGTGMGGGIGYGAGIAVGGASTIVHGDVMRAHVTSSVPMIRLAAPAIAEGSLDRSSIRRYIHRNLEKFTYCYERRLLGHPRLHGTVEASFTIQPDGHVGEARATGVDDEVASCVADVIRKLEFPATHGSGIVRVNYPFVFRTSETPDEPDPVQAAIDAPRIAASAAPAPASASSASLPASLPSSPPAVSPAESPTTASSTTAPPITASSITASSITASPTRVSPAAATLSASTPSSAGQPTTAPVTAAVARPPSPTAATNPASPHTAAPSSFDDAAAPPDEAEAVQFRPTLDALRGNLAKVIAAIHKHQLTRALAIATQWSDEQPTDVLALVGLGEAYEANHDPGAAAREYGSIIDLYPSRAEYRRFAGERLERLGAATRALAIDSYRRAVVDRPDQITGHRLLAYALYRNGDFAGAFAAILAGADQKTPQGRFAGAAQVFARDAGMLGAAYLAHGGRRAPILRALAKRDLELVTEPSTRFILYWETDANDVDLHVRDRFGNHAYFAHKDLASGGALYADITTGYGPECFEIPGIPTAGPYQLGVHYYNQGPMGYGMGLLEIVRFDGRGFSFDDRPYVIMKNQAFVALGTTP
ncbi:MAG: AgmX/PglI C-terminal domain-containing protein [Kofleriaceae bacterium]